MSNSYEYDRADAPADALRLHLNEHTGGCSPRVVEAIRAVSAEDIAKYQDTAPLHASVATRVGVETGQVLLTNGLDEGILAAAIAYLRGEQREAIVLDPAFGMYADCVEAVGGTLVRVAPRGDLDFALDLEAVRSAVTPRTGLLFVTSPGNPTGLSLTTDQILALASLLPEGALLFLDEAYAEFAGDDSSTASAGQTAPSAERAARRVGRTARRVGRTARRAVPTLPGEFVVGRTFAKAYGLAGLRVGALFGPASVIARLKRVVPPYSLNVFVVASLMAALDDTAYTDDYIRQVRESKALLYDACDRLGLGYVKSDTNFVLVHAGARRLALIDGLQTRNIYVRDRHTQPGCTGCLRITTGLVEHTRQCIEAMEEILCARE
jgi:histidinol-phosphate aminotransferase